MIRCVVVAAEGLPKTDFFTGLADPYVKIHLTSVQAQSGGAQDLPVVHSFRTSHVRASLTPEWNEPFILSPHNVEDRLDFEVWDHDVVDEDDIMGSISCHVSDILHHCDGVERWYTLRGPNKQVCESVKRDLLICQKRLINIGNWQIKPQHAGRLALRFQVSEPHRKHLTDVERERDRAKQPGAHGLSVQQTMLFRRMSFQASCVCVCV